jgi:hypothetical protein
MRSERKRRLVGALVGLAAVLSIAAPAMAEVDGPAIYDSLPAPTPPNLPSYGVEAYSFDEIGDHIVFAGGTRELDEVTVLFSSWACENGAWNSGCTSTPDETFEHPITINLYEVDESSPTGVGAQIASVTEKVDVPFRPTADPTCDNPSTPANEGYKWRAPQDGICYSGFAFEEDFDLEGLTVPDEIIFGVEYNTSTQGNAPLGVSGHYDSLNVIVTATPSVGTDPAADVIFIDTTYPDWSNEGPDGLDVFRAESDWADGTIAARFTTTPPITTPPTTPPTTTPPTTPPITTPPTTPPVTPDSDQVGLMDPDSGMWNLRDKSGAVNSFFFGNPGDYPFVGDWNCDGVDTPGLYRRSDGFVYLRNSNTQGAADVSFFFGNPGDLPLAGDFDNDGCDTVSIYRPSEARIYVINELGQGGAGLGQADLSYVFGNPGDKPFVGDFDGDGIDTIGLHREPTGFVYFRQSHTQGIADAEFFFGNPSDRLVAGDWGVVDGTDTPGVFRPSNGTFYFRYTNTQGNADGELVWGDANHMPVAGKWSN